MKLLRFSRVGLKDNARRGGVIVLALIAVMLVAAFSSAFLELARGVTRRQAHAVDTRQAFYVAEAGLAEAYTGLALARTGNVGTPTAPAVFGGGLFWVEATPLDDGLLQLESTGMWGSGRATLGMVVEPFVESMGSLGFFSSNDVRIEPGTVVDSFDSTAGSYEDQLALGINLDQARLGSNGDVSVVGGDEGTMINGDVTHGATGACTTDGNVTISGATAPGERVDLPDVEFPGLPGGSDLVHTAASPLVIPSGVIRFNRVTLEGEVIIVGPATLEVDELTLHKEANLHVDTTAGPVTIFVHDDLNLKSGSSLTCSQEDPTQLSIQVGAPENGRNDNVRLASNSRFFGSIYAPGSEVTVKKEFEVFGAAIADLLVLSKRGRFHFDVGGVAADSGLPVSRNWRVVDIPAAVARNGADPFRALGLNPLDCAMPAEAHEDQVLVLGYVDEVGAARSYDGWESEFDWTHVTQVLYASRDGVVFRPPSDWPVPVVDAGEGADGAPSSEDLPGELTPDEVAAMTALSDPSVNSAAIKNMLLDISPVDGSLLLAALQRVPPMTSSHLDIVLRMNGPSTPDFLDALGTGPLAETILQETLPSPLRSAHLRDVFIQNTPLSDSMLVSIVNSGRLDSDHLLDVLSAQ